MAVPGHGHHKIRDVPHFAAKLFAGINAPVTADGAFGFEVDVLQRTVGLARFSGAIVMRPPIGALQWPVVARQGGPGWR